MDNMALDSYVCCEALEIKKELLVYLSGLCQAASVALMASAVIMPDMRIESMIGCMASAILGGVFIVLKNKA